MPRKTSACQPLVQRNLPLDNVSTVDIVTEEGDKIPVRILAVPTIATPLQKKHYRGISNLPHKRLKLAQPVSGGNIEINMLIGADHYWDIIQDHIIRGKGGPTAMRSSLGYMLSGPPEGDEVSRELNQRFSCHGSAWGE